MKKFLISLTLCLAFSAVSNAVPVDDQCYANFLQIFAGSFDGATNIYINGTRDKGNRGIRITPITNTRLGNPGEQKFSFRKTKKDGIVTFEVDAIKIVNGTISEKWYTPEKNLTAGVLPENWTANMASESTEEFLYSRLGNANDQFIYRTTEWTVILNCSGYFWTFPDGTTVELLKLSYVTDWPASFNHVLRPQKPCRY
ncbi:uncharacterized protein LOC131929410 [Physella acuta]|uniref:uncharacterized protein LOC131929410 n=1 Tax=Physella acuta TaxID=109671 RepID=UPI0027DC1D1D|nr:uncharacterized protein LOC131929410 [Physella acuta]